jgi:hypothetical protein
VRTDGVVNAEDARARLVDALAPVLVLAENAARGRCEAGSLRYVVQRDPLMVQVTLAPDEGRPARRIVAFPGSALPDGGAALASAVEAIAAAILSALPQPTAAATLLNAAMAAAGGLCLLFDPTDATATLFTAVDGKSLGEGVVLGALGDGPETMH